MKRLLYTLLIVSLAKFACGEAKGSYFTTSDGVKLYVKVTGEGTPCLFVHGGPGLTSYIFEATPAAKLIEQKMQMIYYDQRGSGRSASAANGDYSIGRMEKDMEELREHFKFKKWTVMGHSFAGILMTAYARDYQQNISALIYVHCTLNSPLGLQSHIDNGTMLLKEVGDTIHVDQHLSKFDQMMNVHAELAKKGIEYKIMFRSQREMDIEDSLIGATTATGHLNQDFNHKTRTMKDYQIDYSQFTPGIHCPVLIITGTRDYANGPDAYKAWHFKNSTIVLYDGAHTSYQEEPQWFVKTVFDFSKKYHLIS